MAITGLDELRQLPGEIEESTQDAMRLAARDLARLQSDAIEAGRSPDGGAQKPNSPAYQRRKGGKPPLERTGRLKDWRAWRVREQGDGYELLPPADRVDAVRELEGMGYKTIFTDFPRDEAAKLVEAHIAKDMAKRGLL